MQLNKLKQFSKAHVTQKCVPFSLNDYILKVLYYLVNCFRPDNSCWCAFSNVYHLCVFSNYKALIIVFCIVSGNSFGTIYKYLMWLCLCFFFGNTSIPLSLCQYLYISSMAISLSLLNDNISMPLLWQYLLVLYRLSIIIDDQSKSSFDLLIDCVW